MSAIAHDERHHTIGITEADHPYLSAWWPTGHSRGYEHASVHQAADFLTSISEETAAWPSFRDAASAAG